MLSLKKTSVVLAFLLVSLVTIKQESKPFHAANNKKAVTSMSSDLKFYMGEQASASKACQRMESWPYVCYICEETMWCFGG